MSPSPPRVSQAPESRSRRWLLAGWYGRRPLRLLLPLSALFALIAGLRRLLFRLGIWRSERLPVPVVVVGNLVAGGAGKTPVVAALARALQAAGWKPGVLSRGYGGSWRKAALVGVDTTADECGDEALLLAHALDIPVAVGRRRAAAGQVLLAAYPDRDVLICDDGLQHYALARDIELVVVDPLRGFGNGWLLPAGPLREPLSRLRSVDAILLPGQEGESAADVTGLPGLPQDSAAQPPVWVLSSRMQAPQPLLPAPAPAASDWSAWLGRQVHAVAGIGHPERFFAGLRRHGLRVESHPFPDHHPYRAAELDFTGTAPILLTAKDAVKCRGFASTRHWVVPLETRLPEAFLPWLVDLLEKSRGREDS